MSKKKQIGLNFPLFSYSSIRLDISKLMEKHLSFGNKKLRVKREEMIEKLLQIKLKMKCKLFANHFRK